MSYQFLDHYMKISESAQSLCVQFYELIDWSLTSKPSILAKN